MPVRPVNLNLCAERQIGQVGQVIGKESLFHPIHAQLEAIAIGRRSDGIGACLHLAVGVFGHRGNKLTGAIREALKPVDDEDEVVALRNFGDAGFFFKTSGKERSGQGSSRWGRDGARRTG